jgi:hypothetical protein
MACNYADGLLGPNNAFLKNKPSYFVQTSAPGTDGGAKPAALRMLP